MDWLRDNVDEYMECNPAKLKETRLNYESEILYEFCKHCDARIRGVEINNEVWPNNEHIYLFSDSTGYCVGYTIKALEASIKESFDLD